MKDSANPSGFLAELEGKIHSKINGDKNCGNRSSLTIAHLYYTKAQALYFLGDIDGSREAIIMAIRLCPYAIDFTDFFTSLLKNRKKLSISKKAIGLIISCDKYFDRAMKLYEYLTENNAPFEAKIVVGSKASRPPLDFKDLIRVEAGDDYQSLPLKVSEAFMHVSTNYDENIGAFKLDDDVSIEQFAVFSHAITTVLDSQQDYVGMPTGGTAMDRIWHWNKCSEPSVDRKIYSRRFHARWASGAFYYLSPKALRTFTLSRVRFPDEIEGELYEDKFVGDTMSIEDIPLTPISASDLSIKGF